MDDASFDAFYAGSVRRLVGQLYVMTGDLAEAEDCVQEAYVRAWQHRGQLSSQGNPEGWVRSTAWRLAVSRWRRATATLRAYGRHGAAVEAPAREHLDPDLADALRALAPEQRRAIVLFYLCDLPVAAIAAETGTKAGTVRVQLSRGRSALAAALGSRDNDRLAHDPRLPNRHSIATEAPHV